MASRNDQLVVLIVIHLGHLAFCIVEGNAAPGELSIDQCLLLHRQINHVAINELCDVIANSCVVIVWIPGKALC